MYIGRLHYSQQQGEPFLDMESVRMNKRESMLNGLNGQQINSDGILVETKTQAEIDIKKAQLGLESLGMSKEIVNMLEIIERRIIEGSPSDQMYRLVNTHEEKGLSKQKAIRQALIQLTNRDL